MFSVVFAFVAFTVSAALAAAGAVVAASFAAAELHSSFLVFVA